METIINLTCPLYVDLPRKTKKDKRVYINMNSYRNLHFLVNNQVRSQLEGLTIQTPVEITYKVYKKTARRLDKMNVVAITSKYLLDAVTELGCWEDDNDDHVKTEIILPTELDRTNSRVEVIIRSI